jgi:hypothetical protein
VRALTRCGELGDNDLVYERDVGHNIKHRAGKLDGAGLFAGGVNDGYL